MSKTLREATLSTRHARSKLSPGVHWRGLNADVHLGYRRAHRTGRWLVRWYLGGQKYRQETIGAADDALQADGQACLSFEQAKSRALAKAADRRTEARATAAGPIQTVRSAIEAYIVIREAREQGQASRKHDARTRLTKHVLSTSIADRPLYALTLEDLMGWREGLPMALAPETVRRLSNDLKAALNAAAMKHRAIVPADLTLTIKHALKSGEPSPATARDKQALSDEGIRSLVEAARQVDEAEGWDGDLLRMILVLAATGSRFLTGSATRSRRRSDRSEPDHAAGEPQGARQEEVISHLGSRGCRGDRVFEPGHRRPSPRRSAVGALATSTGAKDPREAAALGTGSSGTMAQCQRAHSPVAADYSAGEVERRYRALCAAPLLDRSAIASRSPGSPGRGTP